MFVLPFSLHQISWKFIIRDWVCKKYKLLPASIESVWTKMWTIVRIQPVPAKFCHYTSVCQSLRPHNTKKTIEANPYLSSSKYEKWQVFSFHIDIAISPWSRRGESMKTVWTTKTVLSTSPSPSMPDSATHRCQKKSHTNYHILSKKREQGSTRTKIYTSLWWMKSHPFPNRCQDSRF